MFKKLIYLFLFISIFSLQAKHPPKISDFNNLIQELYDQCIVLISHSPYAYENTTSQILPKKPITDELTQGRYIYLFVEIFRRSVLGGVTALAFYNNAQQIELYKQYVDNSKTGYLIAADIDKTEQEIKDIFNITEPTIIYYHNFEEIGRSNNFNINDMLNRIGNKPFSCDVPMPRFSELKNIIKESYNKFTVTSSGIFPTKFLPKKPIKQELAQLHFSAFLGALQERSLLTTLAITAVAFYDNTKKIESLKNLFKDKYGVRAGDISYLIVADINKTEQEIKNALNITEPTIIFYKNCEEIARSTNFDDFDPLIKWFISLSA